MKTVKEYREIFCKLLIVTGFLLLIFLGFIIYNTIASNSEVREIDETKTSSQRLSVQFISSQKQTDKWETLLKISDETEDTKLFIGETCSCVIKNDEKFNIKNWKLKINIQSECYLNGFWCGDFEVHQFRNGQEITQLIKNSDSDISNLILEVNKYSKKLMVHLLPGDYLVYYPSKEAKEDIILSNSSVGIGFIFYYQNELIFNDYDFIYHNEINIFNTVYFKLILIYGCLWLISLILFHAFMLINQKFMNEMNISIRNISIMAELYHEVHMINIDTDTGYLIKGDKENLLFNFVGLKTKDCFKKYIEEDCKEEYVNDLTKFFDLKLVEELMKSASSISFEYESKKLGWCSLRFFKIIKNNKIHQLIFTVQDINEEKMKYEQEQEKIKQNDFQQFLHNTFIDTFNGSTAEILDIISLTTQKLMGIVQNDEEKQLTTGIDRLLKHYRLLQNCVYDMYSLEVGKFEAKNEQYNLNEIIENIAYILKPFYENKPFEFIQQIDKDIPETLEGDKTRLMQILLLLLYSSFFITEQGTVKLSVFAKQHDTEEELLISIKDSGQGFTEEGMKEVYSFLAGSRINSFENPALVYLKIIDGILHNMNSSLKVVSVYGSGTEFYFSIKQKIIEKS